MLVSMDVYDARRLAVNVLQNSPERNWPDTGSYTWIIQVVAVIDDVPGLRKEQ
jgi:1,2-phenylacetyl-CoA epoxidase catalytic subunit